MTHIKTWQDRMPEHYGDGAYFALKFTAMQAEIDELRAVRQAPVAEVVLDKEKYNAMFKTLKYWKRLEQTPYSEGWLIWQSALGIDVLGLRAHNLT